MAVPVKVFRETMADTKILQAEALVLGYAVKSGYMPDMRDVIRFVAIVKAVIDGKPELAEAIAANKPSSLN